MLTICILEEDQAEHNELKKYLEELEIEKQVHFYNNIEGFMAATHIFDAAPKEEKQIDHIDILILSEGILKNYQEDLTKIKKGLETQKLNPEEPTRIILSVNESKKLDLQGLPIQDLLVKPYEKLLFLQKVEIAANLPENTNPSFLALQDIKRKIEIGKQAKLRGVSDIGIEMINPSVISPGAFVNFYAEEFGENGPGKVLARSYGSYKEEEQIICRFDYYGLAPQSISVIRRNIAKNKGETYPFKRRSSEPKDNVKVIIIDSEEEHASTLKQNLENLVDAVDVISFSSYVGFLKSCFPNTKSEDEEGKGVEVPVEEEEEKQAPKPAIGIKDAESISIFLDNTGKTSQWSFEGGLLLNKNEEQWKAEPEAFMGAIAPQEKERFDEYIDYLLQGNNGIEKFLFLNEDGDYSCLRFTANYRNNGLDIDLEDVTDLEKVIDMEKLEGSSIKLDRIDLLFIDAAFIKNIDGWMEGMQENVKKLKSQAMPQIILTSKKHEKGFVEMYQHRNFVDFLIKPFDRPMLAKKILVTYLPYLENLKSGEPKVEDVTLSKVDSHIMLATPVDILSLSEFGISIRFHAPIVKDRFIHFYLRTFLGMSDLKPILARCYYSEEDEDQRGKFICYFTFLGVTDEIFKQIRLWMRDYYIKSKQE
tara:strand:- start:4389 stop:6332 length:1944 start_codon:yes stop_codon:yes gene_type:complete